MANSTIPKAQYSDIVSNSGLDPRNNFDTHAAPGTSLSTHSRLPSSTTWVGLTLEEKVDLVHELFVPGSDEASSAMYLLTAHYNKLKEINNGTRGTEEGA